MELIDKRSQKYPKVSEIEKALSETYLEERKKMLKEEGLTSSDDQWKGIYNYNRVEYGDVNGKYVPEHMAQAKNAKIWVWREVDTSMPQVKEDSQKAEFRDPESPTYRFYIPFIQLQVNLASSKKWLALAF